MNVQSPALETSSAPSPPPAIVGLTSAAARDRLQEAGANTVAEDTQHPVERILSKFWAPVPWMLEAAIVLQLVLGEYLEAGAVLFLLVFNAALGFVQEQGAQATLDALKSRLAVTASALRDGAWRTLPAPELVKGDVVKLSLGAVVPADVRLIDGSVLVDQSTLTGNLFQPRPVRGSRPTPARSFSAAKPSRKSRPPGRRPSSAAAPN